MGEVEMDFIEKHAGSYVGLDLVGRRSYVITDPKSFELLYNALGAKLKSTAEGKKYANLLSLTKRLVIGQPAIGFTQNDRDGKPGSVAGLDGKYVCIALSAGWAAP